MYLLRAFRYGDGSRLGFSMGYFGAWRVWDMDKNGCGMGYMAGGNGTLFIGLDMFAGRVKRGPGLISHWFPLGQRIEIAATLSVTPEQLIYQLAATIIGSLD